MYTIRTAVPASVSLAARLHDLQPTPGGQQGMRQSIQCLPRASPALPRITNPECRDSTHLCIPHPMASPKSHPISYPILGTPFSGSPLVMSVCWHPVSLAYPHCMIALPYCPPDDLVPCPHDSFRCIPPDCIASPFPTACQVLAMPHHPSATCTALCGGPSTSACSASAACCPCASRSPQ